MRRHHLLTKIILLLLIASLAGCATRIPRRRTLPEWVKSVYVPMFQNISPQPGIEEFGTQYAVEEFLADGRLKVASKADSDLVVAVTIEKYLQEVQSFEDDEFPSISRVSAVADVRLFEPSDMNKPLAMFSNVKATHSFVSDFRRTDYVPDVDARKEVMHELARRVVEQTITAYATKPEDQEKVQHPLGNLEMPYNIRTARNITIKPEVRD